MKTFLIFFSCLFLSATSFSKPEGNISASPYSIVKAQSLSDGNNISLNEAMACGAYCIATDIPANRQWITDKVNGDLVPVNDVEYLAQTIVNAFENYSKLQEKALPVNKNVILEKGIWSSNMKRVNELYSALIKKRK